MLQLNGAVSILTALTSWKQTIFFNKFLHSSIRPICATCLTIANPLPLKFGFRKDVHYCPLVHLPFPSFCHILPLRVTHFTPVGAKGMCMGRDKWLGGELGEDGNVYGIPGATRWSRKSYEGNTRPGKHTKNYGKIHHF